jgi:hypothetical protein
MLSDCAVMLRAGELVLSEALSEALLVCYTALRFNSSLSDSADMNKGDIGLIKIELQS